MGFLYVLNQDRFVVVGRGKAWGWQGCGLGQLVGHSPVYCGHRDMSMRKPQAEEHAVVMLGVRRGAWELKGRKTW